MATAAARGDYRLLVGDCREMLRTLPEKSVHCCVSSPPYFALRDYGVDGQIGREPTPEDFIDALVQVYREVRRVLRDDGCCWVNLGDSYCGGGRGGNPEDSPFRKQATNRGSLVPRSEIPAGLKSGDLMNIPHRVAAALQADGWYWRSTIVWHKRSPMPESVSGWRWIRCRVQLTKQARAQNTARNGDLVRQGAAVGSRAEREAYMAGLTAAKYEPCPGCEKCRDTGGYVLRRGRWRPTNAHEYIFLMSKGERYFCDGDAVQEVATGGGAKGSRFDSGKTGSRTGGDRTQAGYRDTEKRNPRNVWTLSSEPFKGSHFATFPSEIPRRAILASTSAGGCCAACGAQYAPVVDSERVPTRPGSKSKVYGAMNPESPYMDHMAIGNRDPQRHVAVSKISGYRPTCNCNAGVARCVVLDHFAGSGTTGQVAVHLGRDFIGCELNPEYAAIAEQRINTPWQPKTEKKPKRAKRRVQPSQKVLFAD